MRKQRLSRWSLQHGKRADKLVRISARGQRRTHEGMHQKRQMSGATQTRTRWQHEHTKHAFVMGLHGGQCDFKKADQANITKLTNGKGIRAQASKDAGKQTGR